MRRLRWMAGLLVTAVLLAAVTLSLRRMQAPAESSAPDDTLPRYSAIGAHWQAFDEQGQPALAFEAQRIDYFADRSARVTKVKAAMPGGADSPWVARAPVGEMRAGERRMRLSEGVEGDGVWPGGQPLRFETAELWLDFDRHELSTEAGVRLSSRDRNANAGAMLADWRDRSLVLRGKVTTDYVRP